MATTRLLLLLLLGLALVPASSSGSLPPRVTAGAYRCGTRSHAVAGRKKKAKKKRTASASRRRARAPTSTPAAPRPADSTERAVVTESTSQPPVESTIESIVDPSLPAAGSPPARAPWSASAPEASSSETRPSLTVGGAPTAPDDSARRPGPTTWSASSPSAHASETGVVLSAPRPERSLPWLEGSVALHMFYRSQTYNQDLFNVLRPYQIMAPAPAVSLAAYPGALVTSGFPSNLGISAQYEQAFGLSSGISGLSVRFPTATNAFLIGPQYRIPVAPFVFVARAGYGWRSFTITNAGDVQKPQVPSVDYRNVFAQGAVRWQPFDRVAVDLEAGYHYLLSMGELSSANYFPRATGGGLDGTLGVTFLVHPAEVQLAVDVEHYFFSFNPQPGDPLVAGGALDDYLGVRLSARFGVF